MKHGLKLLQDDSDTNRRLAMISIDNAVELMVKTFLGLPKRITGLTISRSEYQEISESFPKLLDALEKHATDKLTGIDLGEIEWYHRLRNQLYHQGNGLTVERNKVEVYARLANSLFENLFGFGLIESKPTKADTLGEFISSWVAFEKAVQQKIVPRTSRIQLLNFNGALQAFEMRKFVTEAELIKLQEIRNARNLVVHGQKPFQEAIKPQMVEFLKSITTRLQSFDSGKK
ncbi:MAG: hypothetical protein ABSC01_05205 [Verrucomicrobiota bacterium]